MSKKHQLDEAMNQTQETPGDAPAENGTPVNNGDTMTEPMTTPENRLTALEAELEEARQAKEEYYQRILRLQADFDNFRRRTRQEVEQINQCAGEDLVKKILPVFDSLERAIHCFTGQDENNCSWQEGVELTLRQFQGIMAGEGLEPVNALNQAFDPQLHEAVAQEASDDVSEPTIIAELQKGYLFRGKLIRPALVKVAVPNS